MLFKHFAFGFVVYSGALRELNYPHNCIILSASCPTLNPNQFILSVVIVYKDQFNSDNAVLHLPKSLVTIILQVKSYLYIMMTTFHS